MNFVLWFVLGLGLCWVEATARSHLGAVLPDPRLLVLSFVMLRTSRRRLAGRVFGLILAAPALGAGTLAGWLIGTALSTSLLFPIRRSIRVDHPLTVVASSALLVLFLAGTHAVVAAVQHGRFELQAFSSAIALLGTVALAAPFTGAIVFLSRVLPLVPRIAPDPADPGFHRDPVAGSRPSR